MINGDKMTPRSWEVYGKIDDLLAVAKYVDVQSMDDVVEEFGIFRVPDTHPHAPEEYEFAYVLNLEVRSNHQVAAENETPLRFTVVKHGLPKSGFMRVLPPGGKEWVGFHALNGIHMDILEPLVDELLESYPQITEDIAKRKRKEISDQTVAGLIKALHSHPDFSDKEIELLDEVVQVFYLGGDLKVTPPAEAVQRNLRRDALMRLARISLDMIS